MAGILPALNEIMGLDFQNGEFKVKTNGSSFSGFTQNAEQVSGYSQKISDQDMINRYYQALADGSTMESAYQQVFGGLTQQEQERFMSANQEFAGIFSQAVATGKKTGKVPPGLSRYKTTDQPTAFLEEEPETVANRSDIAKFKGISSFGDISGDYTTATYANTLMGLGADGSITSEELLNAFKNQEGLEEYVTNLDLWNEAMLEIQRTGSLGA